MWYGKRALTDKEGDVRVVSGQDAERNRQTQVDQDRKKPPPEWQDLMQGCLDEEVDKRPDAPACHQRLAMLYRDTAPPIWTLIIWRESLNDFENNSDECIYILYQGEFWSLSRITADKIT